jgi:hypothetical protein
LGGARRLDSFARAEAESAAGREIYSPFVCVGRIMKWEYLNEEKCSVEGVIVDPR